ncbi:MAG: Competence protein ComEA helix-hairpin-helix repeat protein [Candidatus Roizmanbacteria bacterium GW2011_GWC2_34_23]|uniref:Competence protein ComEA helix-hairpin-helix repeat protein n=1 Tax=Candidatus Roizmanbacteria bacterium GW2011_GWC2_34_23 TaxID=1618484 RepID=A0A0G0BGW5_9BACT|nr:MAG: Competence protein ComEA helix-hairpin-helix repeat protein [Candidatus Roizmanbacteria bacterium GW2011_GWC2_34_23]
MKNFIKSFSPLFKRLKLKKYLLEIFLVTTALIITVAALVIYAKNNQKVKEEIEINPPSLRQDFGGQGKIFVDVSGAVKKPNLYQVDFGARIKEIIDRAGGLSDDADVIFFNRNFNLARILSDQEKIYVPSISEINNGIFVQNQLTLDYTTPITSTGIANNAPTDNINLNSATIEELDQLPGIGQVTANKIISNRPYTTIEELVTKKVVNKGVFEKIKNLISL